MANLKHIGIVLAVSAILVIGLMFYFDFRNSNVNGEELILADENGEPTTQLDGPLSPEEQLVTKPKITNTMNPTAILKTNRGTIEIELFADLMPITVGNFIALAESGFYDSVKFHRVIDGFMIQSGDPNSKGANEATYGTGGSDNIQDEFIEGELLTNTRGTIAMANTGQPNSGSSQWFINLVDNTNLDFDKQPLTSKHPVFGRVIKGMDVVDAIGVTKTKAGNVPVEPIVIESIDIVKTQ